MSLIHSRSFASLVVAALLASSPGAALAKAPSKSEIDTAVLSMPAEQTASVTDAASQLAAGEADATREKNELAAAKLRLEAAKLRVTRSDADLKAIDADLEAAETLGDAADKEALAVARTRAASTLEWARSMVDAGKLEVTWRNQRVNLAKAKVAHREAALEREKLEAWANNGGDADVSIAAGKAFKTSGQKKKAVARAEKPVVKAEKKWQRALKTAERQQPAEGSVALEAAHAKVVAQKDAEIQKARAETGAERDKLTAVRDELGRIQSSQKEQVKALETRTTEASSESDARAEELRRQLVHERAAYEAELNTLRSQIAADAGGEAAKEIAALEAAVASLKARELTSAAEAKAVRVERDEAAKRAAGLEVELAGARTEGSVTTQELENKVSAAKREKAAAVTEAQAERDDAIAERDTARGRLVAAEAALAAASAGGDAAEKDDLLALVATLKRQLGDLKAQNEDQVALAERQAATRDRKHDQRVTELAAALEATRVEGDSLAETAAQAETERNTVLAELSRVKSQRDAQTELVRITEARLADQKADFERRLDALKGVAAGSSQKDGEIAALQAEVDAATKTASQNAERAKTSQAAAEERGARVAELETRAAQLQASVESEKAAAAAASEEAKAASAELTAQLTEAKESVAELTGELQMTRAQAKVADERRGRQIAEAVAAARAEKASDEGLRAEMELQLASAEARAAEIDSSLSSLRLAHDAVTRDLAELQSEKETVDTQLAEQSEKIVSLERQLRSQDQGNKERIAWLQAELSGARSTLSSTTDKLIEIENALRDAERVVARLKAENKALWTRVEK